MKLKDKISQPQHSDPISGPCFPSDITLSLHCRRLAAAMEVNLGLNGRHRLRFYEGESAHGCQMAIARFLELCVFGPSGFLTMAPLCCTAKLDPLLSLDCAPTPSTLVQSKERKGSNFAIWQPWLAAGIRFRTIRAMPVS